jgi:LuxR family transcriptional regulator, maltose regulon positive regulatory protein
MAKRGCIFLSCIDESPEMAKMLIAYLKVQQGSRLSNAPSVSLYVKQLLQALNVTPKEELSLNKILTVQETNILLLISNGLSNKEIVQCLNITVETVKSSSRRHSTSQN